MPAKKQKTTKPRKQERLWLTRVEAAMLCGMSERQFDSVLRERIDADSVQGSGRTLRYHGPGIAAALVAYRLDQAKPAPVADDESDPLLNGQATPNLEKYRGEKFLLARLDRLEREKELVRTNAVRDSLMAGVTAMRGTGDRLVRRFGNEAGEIYNEGVAEFEAAALRTIEQTNAAGDK